MTDDGEDCPYRRRGRRNHAGEKDHAPRIKRREDPSQGGEGVVNPIHLHLYLRHHLRLAHV